MVTYKMVSLYEQYKTEWMLAHGITMSEFIRVLDNYRTEQDGAEFNSIEDVFDSFEADSNGFGGEIWACYDEWQDNEFFDELCERIHGKVCIDYGEEVENPVLHTPLDGNEVCIDWYEEAENPVLHTSVDGHEDVVLSPDDIYDDWVTVVAKFILYGDYATKEEDKSEEFRSILITWLLAE